MGMKEDSEGRAVIDCTTLLLDSAAFLVEVVKIGGEREEEPLEVVKEEALVAALDAQEGGTLGEGGDGEAGSGRAGQGAGGWTR